VGKIPRDKVIATLPRKKTARREKKNKTPTQSRTLKDFLGKIPLQNSLAGNDAVLRIMGSIASAGGKLRGPVVFSRQPIKGHRAKIADEEHQVPSTSRTKKDPQSRKNSVTGTSRDRPFDGRRSNLASAGEGQLRRGQPLDKSGRKIE